MTRNDEDIGYIKSKLDNLEYRVKELDEDHSATADELQSVKQEIAFYRHVIMFVRTLFWIAAAIVTLKFGDIPDIWKGEK